MKITRTKLTVYVSDIEATRNLYVIQLGFGVFYASRNDKLFSIRLGDSILEFVQYHEYLPITWDDFASTKGIGVLLTIEVDEYDECKKRVLNSGSEILMQYGNDSGFRFKDPDGYIIEICRGVK